MKHSWSEWPLERSAMLRELWDQGLSSLEIGRRMQCTKNCVIGRARRMELAPRGSPIRYSCQTHFANSQKPVIPPRNGDPKRLRPDPVGVTTLPRLVCVPIVPAPVVVRTTPRLPSKRCRWPLGDPRDAAFCFCVDRVARLGVPYCKVHMRTAYLPRRAS